MFSRLNAAIIFLALSTLAVASDYGEPDTKLLPEADQWMYARGDWDVTTTYRDENGDMQKADRVANVVVEYLADGLTVQSTFTIGDEFFSVQIRSYDRTQEKWMNHFINSKRQRWAVTESRWIDGKMVTLNSKGYSNSEPHMTREIDSDISANRFVKRIRRSEDLGDSWGPVLYIMEFNRKEVESN
jgi:hypothetical protein